MSMIIICPTLLGLEPWPLALSPLRLEALFVDSVSNRESLMVHLERWLPKLSTSLLVSGLIPDSRLAS
jgi:hypothetical protein